MLTEQELQKGFMLGDWEVLPGRRILRRGRQVEQPEPKVFDVLMVLAARNGETVSRDELNELVWGGRAQGDEPINRCVSLLRRHLGDRRQEDNRNYHYVQVLTRVGYRLAVPVQLSAPGEQPAARSWVVRRGMPVKAVLLAAALVAVGVAVVMLPPVAPRSIAVLPFDNPGGDPAQDYWVIGIRDEMVRTLSGLPELVVKPARISYPDLEVSEIASQFDAEAVLFGTVQRQVNTIKISYNIVDGSTGSIIASNSVAGAFRNLFALQERVASMVRNDLLGESPQELMATSRPANFEAFDRYMLGLYVFDRRAEATNLEQSMELFEETIRLDPRFGPAYLSLAMAYALLPDHRGAPLEASLQQAMEWTEKGMAVDPNIRDAAYTVFGFVYTKQRQWSHAEAAFERAINASVVDSTAYNWYARMLATVGRPRDALAQALAARRLDPSSAVINSLVASLYTILGDTDHAAEAYARLKTLNVSDQYVNFGNALLFMRQGQFAEARQWAASAASRSMSNSTWVGSVFSALAGNGDRNEALAQLDAAAASSGDLDPRVVMALHSVLGDVDGAMKIADRITQAGTFYFMDLIYLPELKPMREHADFFRILDNLGVRQYWVERGCNWANDALTCS